MIWILFYYNSLPDMPLECALFSTQIMHRDFFKCNPTNTGHHTYPKFETLSYDEGCHPREVKNYLAKNEPDKYVVFYTRHTALSGKTRNKIVGYFKVGRNIKRPKIGFLASDSILLPKDKCIEIDYSSRGVPVSWGNSSVRQNVDRILNDLLDSRTFDISYIYKEETKRTMDKLSTISGRKRTMGICEQCVAKNKCCWGRKTRQYKENKLKELYGANRECSTSC